eukprot:TRINITY_DN12805_c0_g2_i2.p1 TRINITY_DN12805_c0_g2~~TRINITY_DN12805_c0_g2_i2.p1  ORF type:complete len:147 (+),score=0.22 TRINITY_DN12805_c0_g2_i2:80-520(+)
MSAPYALREGVALLRQWALQKQNRCRRCLRWLAAGVLSVVTVRPCMEFNRHPRLTLRRTNRLSETMLLGPDGWVKGTHATTGVVAVTAAVTSPPPALLSVLIACPDGVCDVVTSSWLKSIVGCDSVNPRGLNVNVKFFGFVFLIAF